MMPYVAKVDSLLKLLLKSYTRILRKPPFCISNPYLNDFFCLKNVSMKFQCSAVLNHDLTIKRRLKCTIKLKQYFWVLTT